MSDSSAQQAPDGPDEPTPEQRRALFRVVRGEPDDAEVAALAAVLAAAASAAGPTTRDTRGQSVWVDRVASARVPLHPGPGAWRNSTWPR